MLGTVLHAVLHLLVPGVVAFLLYRERWRRAWLIMLLTLVVDVDHLLAHPVFDPGRCSIGYHPLHTVWAIAAYTGLLLVPALRLIGLGLLIHMALDGLECVRLGLPSLLHPQSALALASL